MFSGWPRAALDFFAGLEVDNSRDYFQANRAVYDEAVKAPFLELSAIVEREFGPLHLFRPHRDVRFSRDKSPYKTAAGAVTEGRGGTAYYAQISAEGLMVASGYYMPTADQLERWRAAVDDRAGASLLRAVDALRARRYEVGAHDTLKTAPRGYSKAHPRIELLRMKGLTVGRRFAPAGWLHTGAALNRILTVWRDAAPVNSWLDRHVGPSTNPPREPS